MKKGMQFLCEKWFLVFTGGLLFLQGAVFLIFRENSYIQVHDNLDLFVAQLQIMKNTDTFFARDAVLPMLGGISRNTFGSEFSLYNILFYFLPAFWAYMAGYALKIGIGMFSFSLLAKDIYKEKYVLYRPLVTVLGAAFGMIPVFPAYGIAFTSIPLLVYFLRKIYREPNKWWYLGVFLYPLLSYFSYFGFFILAYMVCAIIILWIKDRHFPGGMTIALFVLAAGYILFENRLFMQMLLNDEITIRSSMLNVQMSLEEIVRSVWDVFFNTEFHAQDSHRWLELPVCIIGLVIVNASYVIKKEWKKILTDSCNLIFGFIIFNCLVYGLYNWKEFRELIERLVPQLTGFQFNRTTFFNPFLWYALFFLLMKRLYDSKKKWLCYGANALVMAAALVVMFKPQMYNDFYDTCYYNAYKIVKQTTVNNLNYREYYSTDLFEEIKEEMGYEGEWSAAYGLNPAVLQYNGIATLDGYLGFYSQEYKEKFRKVIAPALDTAPGNRYYFDEWGARAYLFSASDESTYAPKRDLGLQDTSLAIDTDAYRELGGRYIFSTIEISNREELGLTLTGTYSNDTSPYTIRVYEVPVIDKQ